MRSLGILTYHKYYNYGTMLQAYALCKAIQNNFDCTAEIIDFMPKNDYVGKKLVLTRFKRIFTYIKDFDKYYNLYKFKDCELKKQAEFDKFYKNNLKVSNERFYNYESLKKQCEKYQAVMIGSDQTWNPYVSRWRDFLLEFLSEKETVKLSYAPSIGTGKIPEEYREIFKRALSEFSALSCREEGGAKILSELLGKTVSPVLDPTLLLKPEEWEKVSSDFTFEKPYLLTYFLGDNPEHRKTAENIAKQKGLEIRAIPMSYLEMKNRKIRKETVGPDGFISLIKNADFICTDSFHGTMFSVNFKKNFLSFQKRKSTDINSDNNRLSDALKTFGLENRLCLSSPDLSDIDYSNAEKILEEKRAKSYSYLKTAIDLIPERKL